MTKQANPNIGDIACPICAAASAVRKNRAGKLYMDCMNCGRIYPNHAGGQRYMLEKSRIWPEGKAPADVPAWIREQWPYSHSVRHRDFEDVPDAMKAAPVDLETPAAVEQPTSVQGGDDLPPPPVRRPVGPIEPEPQPAPASDSFVIL